MTKRTIKTRIIATALSVVTLFSLFSACATTSASALEIDYKGIIKEAASNGAEKAIDAVTEEGIFNTVLKKGVNFLLGLLFDEDDNSPTIQDVLDKLDNLSSKLESYHDEEMKNSDSSTPTSTPRTSALKRTASATTVRQQSERSDSSTPTSPPPVKA